MCIRDSLHSTDTEDFAIGAIQDICLAPSCRQFTNPSAPRKRGSFRPGPPLQRYQLATQGHTRLGETSQLCDASNSRVSTLPACSPYEAPSRMTSLLFSCSHISRAASVSIARNSAICYCSSGERMNGAFFCRTRLINELSFSLACAAEDQCPHFNSWAENGHMRYKNSPL